MRHGFASSRRGVLVTLVVLASSCIRMPPPPPPPPPVSVRQVPVAQARGAVPAAAKSTVAVRDPDVLVWLLADTLHTAMVFPYAWLEESGFIPPAGFGHPRYVALSWGERTAYVQKAWLNPWQVFRAFFTPSPSVMEIIPVNWYVVEVCQHQRVWRKLVARRHGPELAAFLNHVSRSGPDGRPVVIGPSSWGDGMLLESRHSYHLPRICNVWTAQALEACGCEVNPWLALTANGLIRQAEHPRNGFENVWRGDDK
ncbi:MAG: DUF2459 domain-containing protein [Verrucomicrobia bacterium]|nr:DUF2459 domain-containing protein [Verrucomicrobiota bacterium]